jgi:RHS repeat-associated protein
VAWFSPADLVSKNPLGGFKVLAAPLNGPNLDLLLQTENITTTINYSYDPLYRLTAADYDDGTFFHYTYDAVGNRLTQTTNSGTSTYTYDIANRLTSVDGATYIWDNNGNLLSDGSSTYIYDSVNQLVSLDGPITESLYVYNGLGNRLQQTVNGVTTNYTLDIAGSLSQVLEDGMHTYLYGNGRIAQKEVSGAQYYLDDSLGSVRQLVSTIGLVTLAQSYEPYGDVLNNVGNITLSYGFTGQWLDPSGLIYSRARYYSSFNARYLSRDVMEGNYLQPQSLIRWNYVQENPINYSDPSGFTRQGPDNFINCFDLAAVTHGFGFVTARQAVNICRIAFNKNEWGLTPADTLPKSVGELWAWYLNEHGDDHLWFDGKQPLTRELAKSTLIHDLRVRFYIEGNLNLSEKKFNGIEFLGATLFDTRNAPLINIPITHFLGSFWYQVIKLSNDRVGFRIDNDTTMESGTHIRGRYKDEGFTGSVEEYIFENPSKANEPLSKVINESDVISILPPRSRANTTGSNGGGDMYQTFTWSEKYDECIKQLMPWHIVEVLLDIQPWQDFRKYTDPVFENVYPIFLPSISP